jgi:uncharacterized protein (DUF2237 family)
MTPEELVLKHALECGYLSGPQIAEARAICAQLQREGKEVQLLALLAERWLRPEQVTELAAVYRDAGGSEQRSPSGRLPKRDFLTGLPNQIGPYAIERELARGGMGVVLVGRDEHLDRQVAIKVVLGVKGTSLQRFRREAQATARLRHPNIVALHEFGSQDGLPYLVMDLIEGVPLNDLIEREGCLPNEEAARFTERLADALACAHAQGVLHRDVKPSNVLITPGREPLLTDFGLAKIDSPEEEDLTKTGSALGTPAYMPPEQAAGEKSKIDARSDVYSLGATLYEMLVGHSPFRQTSALALVMAVINDPPERPRKLRSSVDPALEAICLRCLRKEPEGRFPSARALADALAAWRLRRGSLGSVAGAAHSPWRLSAATIAGLVLGGALVASLRPARAPGVEAEAPAASASQDPQVVSPTAAAFDAKGWRLSAEEVRWEQLRSDPADLGPLEAILRASLEREDLGSLGRGWAEVHRRLGRPGAPLLQQVRASERARAARDLALASAPLGERVRAALEAPAFSGAELLGALQLARRAEVPLLAGAALASQLAMDSVTRDAGPTTPRLEFAAFCELVAQDRVHAVCAALTLLEHAQFRWLELEALRALVKTPRPLVRAALALAIAVGVARGQLAEAPALELLGGLADDGDPLVRGRAQRARRVLAFCSAAEGATLEAGHLRLLFALSEPGDRLPRLSAARGRALEGLELGEAPTLLLRATHALRAGRLDVARADVGLALEKAPDDVEARLLEAQLRCVDARESEGPLEQRGADPIALARANERLRFTQRFGLFALAGVHGAIKVVARFAPGSTSLKRGLRILPMRQVQSSSGIATDSYLVVRTRFSFSSWDALRLVGSGPRGSRVSLHHGVARHRANELALRIRPDRRAPRQNMELVGRAKLGRWRVRESRVGSWSLSLGRGQALVVLNGRSGKWAATEAPRGDRGGLGWLRLEGPKAALESAVFEGRWNPAYAAPEPPSPASLERWEASLRPLPDTTALRSFKWVFGPAETLGALRERGQMLHTERAWNHPGRSADSIWLPGVRGDLEVVGSMTFTPGAEEQIGLALEEESGERGVLWFGPTRNALSLFHSQRDGLKQTALMHLSGAWPKDLVLRLRVVGAYVFLAYSTPEQDGFKGYPGSPFLNPLAGSLKACLFARVYDKARKRRPSIFRDVEMSRPAGGGAR